jgi:hypothetical protein
MALSLVRHLYRGVEVAAEHRQADAEQAAADFYALLHKLDKQELHFVIRALIEIVYGVLELPDCGGSELVDKMILQQAYGEAS